jgi:1,4-alpha-glucan branching enzyme
MARGYWMLVLHAHLPYVRHPEYNDSLEERWLYEAITETYIPFLDIFERLLIEGVDYRVTLSLTPPLCNMLSDALLQERYLKKLESLIELAEKELERTKFIPEFHRVAEMYMHKFKRAHQLYTETYNRNLLMGFKKYQDLGKLEILTSGATHGFLPLMNMYPNAVRGQVLTAVEDYKRHFGRAPKGMWNAECGYYPELENLLAEGNIKYFFTDTHGVLHADQYPKYGVFAPMFTPNKIAFFGRDVETSHSVWSAKEGYPGDPSYREFYRDIGFDLEYDYVKPYIHESGLRISTGMKYHKITSKETPMEYKQPYDPQAAYTRAVEHASNFVFNREKQINYLSEHMDREPVVVSMYDAELFGHWWYEGPEFLYNVLKIMSKSPVVKNITAPEYLDKYPSNQKARPPLSSWGYKGYNEFWLNGTNDWVYPHLHKADERMIDLANKHMLSRDKLLIRALNQAARELLLAQSSDWAFIMKTNTMVDYAVKRTKDHLGRFQRLFDMIREERIDESWLKETEYRDNIFPEMDYRVFADR